jgi:hypothetical protein
MPTGLFTTRGRKIFEGDVHLSPKHTAHLSCGHGLPPIPRSGEFFLFHTIFCSFGNGVGGFFDTLFICFLVLLLATFCRL